MVAEKSESQMSGIIRNAIAAFSIVITLGGGGLKFYDDFRKSQQDIDVLKNQMSGLQRTVDAIYCKLDPQSISCVYQGRER